MLCFVVLFHSSHDRPFRLFRNEGKIAVSQGCQFIFVIGDRSISENLFEVVRKMYEGMGKKVKKDVYFIVAMCSKLPLDNLEKCH